jgi:putative transposase
MRFEFIRAEKEQFPVAAMCRVLAVSRSGFYRWLKHEPSKRERRRARVAVKVAAAYQDSNKT